MDRGLRVESLLETPPQKRRDWRGPGKLLRGGCTSEMRFCTGGRRLATLSCGKIVVGKTITEALFETKGSSDRAVFMAWCDAHFIVALPRL